MLWNFFILLAIHQSSPLFTFSEDQIYLNINQYIYIKEMQEDKEEIRNEELENQQQQLDVQGLIEKDKEKDNNDQLKISKKKIKKMAKKQKWQSVKKQKKQQKKQKQKQKKKLKLLQKQVNPKQQMIQKIEIVPTRKRKDQYRQKMNQGLKVVIDIQFYDQMTQKQQSSLIKQLSYCHCTNRQYPKPFNFIISSANQSRQNLLNQKYNASNWGIQIYKQSLLDLFPIKQIIYLTGDATQDLQNLDENNIYIIGGIVDHNRLKRITINYAQKHQIKCRRLPMEGVQLKASVHLAVNHVWEWMLRVYNGQSWGEAIKAVIPSRKINDEEKQKEQQKQKQI